MNIFKKIFGKKEKVQTPKSVPSIPSVEKPSIDIPSLFPWLELARKEIGTKEISGSKHNSRILEYHSATKLKATEDEVPWCSSFVSWCLEQSGIESTKNAWARSYLSWGQEIKTPAIGCIVVFSRGQGSGHVAFYLGESGSEIQCLGGNQGDKVCIASYPKSRVLGYRLPKNK